MKVEVLARLNKQDPDLLWWVSFSLKMSIIYQTVRVQPLPTTSDLLLLQCKVELDTVCDKLKRGKAMWAVVSIDRWMLCKLGLRWLMSQWVALNTRISNLACLWCTLMNRASLGVYLLRMFRDKAQPMSFRIITPHPTIREAWIVHSWVMRFSRWMQFSHSNSWSVDKASSSSWEIRCSWATQTQTELSWPIISRQQVHREGQHRTTTQIKRCEYHSTEEWIAP